MANESSVIEGSVAEILSNTQLIITPGRDEGVKVGDRFQIIAAEKEQVRDPLADRVLEEIPVIKATVTVITVHEKCSAVENSAKRTEVRSSGIGALAGLTGGRQEVTLTDNLPVGASTMDRVSRTITIGDRCVKI